MTRRQVVRLLAACALLTGCAEGRGPAEPVWGKEPCAHCGMVLSDRRFGAQLLEPGGDRFFFDDSGCLVLFLEERGMAPVRAWVRDAESQQWLDILAARFAGGASSPMGFGFEARASGSVPWAEMRGQVLERARNRL